MVVSENGALQNHADALSSYYDMLLDNAFGNFRALLKAVTLHPAMGMYLNMQGNDTGSIITGTHANENYAREIKQLFSIGLNRDVAGRHAGPEFAGQPGADLQPECHHGIRQRVHRLELLPDQPGERPAAIELLSRRRITPTRWCWCRRITNSAPNCCSTMSCCRRRGAVRRIRPPPTYDDYCSQDLETALDSIFNNQNVGPFICRQLIQRLVTSNPSRDYLYRVAQVFNDNGTGVRGDMQAVIKAILLDYEARSTNMISQPTYGKQREPLLRVTALARAFPAPPDQSAALTARPTNQVDHHHHCQPALAEQRRHRVADFHRHFRKSRAGLAGLQRDGHQSDDLHRQRAASFHRHLRPDQRRHHRHHFRPRPGGRAIPVYLVFTTGGASTGCIRSPA